eukprot:482947-Hanusia_phi.AAC.1
MPPPSSFPFRFLPSTASLLLPPPAPSFLLLLLLFFPPLADTRNSACRPACQQCHGQEVTRAGEQAAGAELATGREAT